MEGPKATKLRNSFQPITGSTLAIGDHILIADPFVLIRRMGPHQICFGFNELNQVPIGTVRILQVDHTKNFIVVRIAATNMSKLDNCNNTPWPHGNDAMGISIPDRALKLIVTDTRTSPAAQTNGATHLIDSENAQDNHQQPESIHTDMSSSDNTSSSTPGALSNIQDLGFTEIVDSDETTPTSSSFVQHLLTYRRNHTITSTEPPTPVGSVSINTASEENDRPHTTLPEATGPVNDSSTESTSQEHSDRAKAIRFLIAALPPELLSAATNGHMICINSYQAADHINTNMCQHWLDQIDMNNLTRQFRRVVGVVRGSVFATHLALRQPEIAIRMYTWQWTLYENRDAHTTLFLEYFLDAQRYRPITTTTLLYHAVYVLNSVIRVLFGWEDILRPILQALRPAGMTTENCFTWTRYIYKTLAKCTAATLDIRYHNVTHSRNQNEAIIRNIIKKAMTASQRAQEPGGFLTGQEDSTTNPLVFPDLVQHNKADRSSYNTTSTHGEGPETVTPSPPHTTGSHTNTTTTTVSTQQTTPSPPTPPIRICVRAWMHHYGINFPDKTSKCVNKHNKVNPTLRRLHPEDILTVFPNRYNRTAAQQQVRLYLHDKVELAERVTTAMEADIMYFK